MDQRNLRIGYDAKRLYKNFTGLGYYSRTLVSNIKKKFSFTSIFLFTPGTVRNSDTESFFSDDFHLIKPKRNKFLWRTLQISRLLKKYNIDIYHGLSHELPIGIEKSGVKSVVTIHDLIYLFYPEDFPWIDRKVYNWKFRNSCKKANQIVSISDSTKRDLIKYFKLEPDKITVIPQGYSSIFDKEFNSEEKLELRKKYNLPDKYILYVGSIIKRKNLKVLIKAFEQIESNLVIVGTGKNRYSTECRQMVRKLKLTEKIHFIERPGREDLPGIYQNASCLAFPSLYEGFGIPILEAFASRCPVACSDRTSFPEVGGEAVLYFDPSDPISIANSLLKLNEDPTLRAELIQKGIQRLKLFDRENIAQQYFDVYQKLLTSSLS
jgi:glycosyltransferase involved in cell wall biosynthesis